MIAHESGFLFNSRKENKVDFCRIPSRTNNFEESSKAPPLIKCEFLDEQSKDFSSLGFIFLNRLSSKSLNAPFDLDRSPDLHHPSHRRGFCNINSQSMLPFKEESQGLPAKEEEEADHLAYFWGGGRKEEGGGKKEEEGRKIEEGRKKEEEVEDVEEDGMKDEKMEKEEEEDEEEDEEEEGGKEEGGGREEDDEDEDGSDFNWMFKRKSRRNSKGIRMGGGRREERGNIITIIFDRFEIFKS